jgi:hypothetical protein
MQYLSATCGKPELVYFGISNLLSSIKWEGGRGGGAVRNWKPTITIWFALLQQLFRKWDQQNVLLFKLRLPAARVITTADFQPFFNKINRREILKSLIYCGNLMNTHTNVLLFTAVEPQSNASALKRLLSNGTVASPVSRDGEERRKERETAQNYTQRCAPVSTDSVSAVYRVPKKKLKIK